VWPSNSLNLRKAAIFTFHGSVLAILNQQWKKKLTELTMKEQSIANLLFRWGLEKYVRFAAEML